MGNSFQFSVEPENYIFRLPPGLCSIWYQTKTVRIDSRVILLLSGLISTPLKRRKFTSSLADRRASWLRNKAGQLPAVQQSGQAAGLCSKAGQLPAAQQGGPTAG